MKFEIPGGFKGPASVAGAILLPILGWVGNSLLSVSSQKQVLDQHTVQIQQLQHGQKETHDALTDIKVAIEHVDGQVGVLNQKIDDDRAANAKKH